VSSELPLRFRACESIARTDCRKTIAQLGNRAVFAIEFVMNSGSKVLQGEYSGGPGLLRAADFDYTIDHWFV
jgi:hypothetical protein